MLYFFLYMNPKRILLLSNISQCHHQAESIPPWWFFEFSIRSILIVFLIHPCYIGPHSKRKPVSMLHPILDGLVQWEKSTANLPWNHLKSQENHRKITTTFPENLHKSHVFPMKSTCFRNEISVLYHEIHMFAHETHIFPDEIHEIHIFPYDIHIFPMKSQLFTMKSTCFSMKSAFFPLGTHHATAKATPPRSPSAAPTWRRSCQRSGRGVRKTQRSAAKRFGSWWSPMVNNG